MGVVTKIVSKIGADPHGKKVIELCRQNNIDTQHLVSEEKNEHCVQFHVRYIVTEKVPLIFVSMADVANGTRTIVHNPAQ
jgi:hypothetical protein